MVSKYTTVERGEFNRWWVWSNGDYLRTSEVVRLLNEQDKEISELKEDVELLIDMIIKLNEYREKVEKINQEFRVLLYCYEKGIL